MRSLYILFLGLAFSLTVGTVARGAAHACCPVIGDRCLSSSEDATPAMPPCDLPMIEGCCQPAVDAARPVADQSVAVPAARRYFLVDRSFVGDEIEPATPPPRA